LITLDRAWSEHATTILGRAPASSSQRRVRDGFTFVFRIALLVGSLTITAPYLAELVFHKDISRFVGNEATQAIDQGRKNLSAKFDAAIAGKDAEIVAKRAAFEREVSGKGLSGRYGLGAAAQSIRTDTETLRSERDTLFQEEQAALGKYDRLARDWEANRAVLGASYNVELPQTSILTNRRALDELRKRPENRSVEWAIKAFLAFIFGALLLLKLFEPSSIRLYLSEVLQQEYDRYLAGTFDAILPPTERSTNRTYVMSPQRLYDFLLKQWAPARRIEEGQTDAKARRMVASHDIQLLKELRDQISREVLDLRTNRERARTAADSARKDLTDLESAIKIVRADVEHFMKQLDLREVPSAELDEIGRLKFETRHVEYESSLRSQLAEANRLLNDLYEKQPGVTRTTQRADEELRDAEQRLQRKDEELGEAEVRLGKAREHLASAASERARSVLGSPIR